MGKKAHGTANVALKPMPNDRYIVAIGASAGGLEAIHEFFDNMPGSNSFSYVVIQHLSPDYKSLLVELVSKHTHMKVFEAGNDMMIQQDCIYIIPNNKTMTVRHGKLRLADKSIVKAPNTAIDIFLQSLAQDKKDKAIAVILSGTGTDGTKGIEAIKESGGMVMVQDPATAKFDGMPNSAIASGYADYITAPSLMSIDLFNFIDEEPIKILEDGRVDELLLDEIFTLVHRFSGNDFNLYKTPTIIRRIGRRMNEKGTTTLHAYVDLLRTDPEEVRVLGQDFLIGVTKFFRDEQAFELLSSKILPDLIDRKNNGETLKIWVCACSTGQEAYSIAVLVYEYLQNSGRDLDVKIFATDIDDKSIEIASRNQFPLASAKEIPQVLFEKYFLQEGKYFGVLPQIRKQLVFAKHDVIKSPPFIKNDLVTCRNMLIYVNPLLQQKILSTFHFSLVQSGYLLLGSSETAVTLKQGLTELDSKWKLYQKSGQISYSTFNTYTNVGRIPQPQEKKKVAVPEPPLTTIEKDFNTFITEELGYVGIFIDKDYMIKDVVGNYKKFLSLPEKKIELNLLKMVPREVGLVLNASLRKAWKENKKTHLNRIRIKSDENEVFLNISIQPPGHGHEMQYTMIVLGESLMESISQQAGLTFSEVPGELHSEYIYELEAELSETRNNLQMAVEEMETTNEELQSTNEELLSSNEELQSSNEELQSLNEELHTLNTEHQMKIKELVELNDDLDNYFRSAEIGQIFLDSRLYIRKFNPAAVSMVNLIEPDIGRSIEQISNNIKSENFISDIRTVLLNHAVIEKEVLLKNGNRSLMRVMPYLRKDKTIDGVVITFVDISQVTELNNMINGVFNASTNGILAFSAERNADNIIVDFRCIAYNNAAKAFLNKKAEELSNVSLQKQLPELSKGSLFNKFINVVEKQNVLQTEMQLPDLNWFHLVVVKMSDGFVATLTNITERKAAEQKLRKNYNELITARENLKELNRDLEGKVSERTRRLSESEERFNQVSHATNDTIWDWNLVNNIIWRSENFSTMFGYSLNGQTSNIDFWFKNIHPDDRERVKKGVNEAINNKDEQWSAEYRFRKSDGTYVIILDRGSILLDDLQMPYRMVGSIVDITRLMELQELVQKQQEEFFAVFKNAPALISIRKGPLLVFEFANQAFEAFYGLKDYIGKSIEELKIPHYNPEFAEIERGVMESGQSYIGKAVYIHKVDRLTNANTDKWFDVIFTPLYAEDNTINGIAFFGFDVTDLILAQQATKDLMQKKDEFMSIASHELKTPITSIKGSLQIAMRLMQKEESDARTFGFIDKANRQVGKLTTLVDDLLDVTKIQAGKMEFNFSDFSINELLLECIDDVQRMDGHQIVLKKIDDVLVNADKLRLEQVIGNLLSNAIKYSPNEKLVEIYTQVEGDTIKVTVKDFGIGIPKDKKEMVFDRFFRVQESSYVFAGLGLGLYISSEIVRRHGGTIGVESEEQKGSEFWFRIPLKNS